MTSFARPDGEPHAPATSSNVAASCHYTYRVRPAVGHDTSPEERTAHWTLDIAEASAAMRIRRNALSQCRE